MNKIYSFLRSINIFPPCLLKKGAVQNNMVSDEHGNLCSIFCSIFEIIPIVTIEPSYVQP